jgi:hypothetical protein
VRQFDVLKTMNTNDNQPESQPMIRTIFQPRTDVRTRDIINQAVASIPTVGLQRAAEFLEAMNIPPETAVRVLVYPNRRRVF